MHEFSIMQVALEQALAEARRAKATHVREIRLRVGVLSGVVPDALQFAFEALAPGTAAEGGKLMVEEVPARFHCAVCVSDFESANLFAKCPKCGCAGELRGGRELELSALEVEND